MNAGSVCVYICMCICVCLGGAGVCVCIIYVYECICMCFGCAGGVTSGAKTPYSDQYTSPVSAATATPYGVAIVGLRVRVYGLWFRV